jgi:hypothetical protein
MLGARSYCEIVTSPIAIWRRIMDLSVHADSSKQRAGFCVSSVSIVCTTSSIL